MTEPYFWHLHPDSDETFLVLEGRLEIAFRATRHSSESIRRRMALSCGGRQTGAARFVQTTHLAQFDRTDVLFALYEFVGVPGAPALLRPAVDMLGCIIRDASIVRALLGEIRASDFVFRRAVVVALGLLDHVVPRELGIHRERAAPPRYWADRTLLCARHELVVDGAPRFPRRS